MRSVPIIGDEKIERTTKRFKAAREPGVKIILGCGLAHGLARDRLNDADHVLDAMAQFICDDAQPCIFSLNRDAPRVGRRPERGPCADVCFACEPHRNSPLTSGAIRWTHTELVVI
jgi:hypothetical protein